MSENYNMASQEAEKMIRKFIQERMEEKEISQYKLAQLTDLAESTLSRWMKGESNISLINFLKVLGALEIRPYFVPSEMDKNTIVRHYFN